MGKAKAPPAGCQPLCWGRIRIRRSPSCRTALQRRESSTVRYSASSTRRNTAASSPPRASTLPTSPPWRGHGCGPCRGREVWPEASQGSLRIWLGSCVGAYPLNTPYRPPHHRGRMNVSDTRPCRDVWWAHAECAPTHGCPVNSGWRPCRPRPVASPGPAGPPTLVRRGRRFGRGAVGHPLPRERKKNFAAIHCRDERPTSPLPPNQKNNNTNNLKQQPYGQRT